MTLSCIRFSASRNSESGAGFSAVSSLKELIHLVKALYETASIAIGINEWLDPQISEHWP